jgi:hypothetical protein
MATIEVTLSPSLYGKSGKLCQTIQGWRVLGVNADTGRIVIERTTKLKGDAWNVALSYCKRHGHGLLNMNLRRA